MGTDCWFLVYQAESRMRSEHFERLKRKLESDYNRVKQDGGSTALVDYNPKRPWNSVLHAA
eukprot:3887483-Amphidinium_carterae.1